MLPYNGIYLFYTEELALKAASLFPNLKKITEIIDPNSHAFNEDGNVEFQVCYQVYIRF